MANDITGINDIYENGLNDVYGEMPAGETVEVPTSRLPATGQIISYQAGDDGDVESGVPSAGRFTTEDIGGDVVVHDLHTGLTWIQDPYSVLNGGDYDDVWAACLNLIAAVNIVGFAGFQDWHMPNVLEAISMYDFGTQRINAVLNCNEQSHWTSTTKAKNSDYAAILSANDWGYPIDYYSKTMQKAMWACRENIIE